MDSAELAAYSKQVEETNNQGEWEREERAYCESELAQSVKWLMTGDQPTPVRIIREVLEGQANALRQLEEADKRRQREAAGI